MTAEKTIELIHPTLGLNPFVLIQLRPDQQDPNALKIGIEFGGGLSTEDIVSTLRLVLEELNPDGEPA